MTATTFLVPDFDKNIPNKINQDVEVKSKNTLQSFGSGNWHPATATNGFSSKKDGLLVYVTRIDQSGNGGFCVSFTEKATNDSTSSGRPGDNFSGTLLSCFHGN